MLSVIVFIGSLVLSFIILLGSRPIFAGPALARRNYAGREVPTAGGTVIVLTYLIAYAVIILFVQSSIPGEALLILVIGMSFLGLLDDVAGDPETRGFRGHLGALFKGHLTTGLVKALGGLIIAAVAAQLIARPAWEIALDAVLIALSANLFNLVDLRPGRAIKMFVPFLVAVVAITWSLGDAYIPYALSVGAAALALFGWDLREKLMIGDTGANVLGATIGLGLALGAGSWWKLGLVLTLAFASVLSEKYSFSSMIEDNRALKWLDMLGRKGESFDRVKYT